ncbi:MAG TPA: class I SAM-dependent methyltransferase, partial [Burkholderiales bacterium]|nr:class I SAM-dependent methyltransferase [Burkholderiales bacterium]
MIGDVSSPGIGRLFAACCLAALAGVAAAQPVMPELPMPGEIGKDVMWIPSDDVMVTRMLDAARVTSRDYLVDLGSGDGRIVIAAALRGARALGVEYNAELVAYARARASRSGLSGRARFVHGDMFRTDLFRASVITLFLLEENNLKLRPRLLGLRPGTRIVSNSFAMG